MFSQVEGEVRSDVIEDVATTIVERSKENVNCSNAHAISGHLAVSHSTVLNVLRKMMQRFPYKIVIRVTGH